MKYYKITYSYLDKEATIYYREGKFGNFSLYCYGTWTSCRMYDILREELISLTKEELKQEIMLQELSR